MTERNKILFGMNTFGGPRNIVLDGGSDILILPQLKEGGDGKNFAHCGPITYEDKVHMCIGLRVSLGYDRSRTDAVKMSNYLFTVIPSN